MVMLISIKVSFSQITNYIVTAVAATATTTTTAPQPEILNDCASQKRLLNKKKKFQFIADLAEIHCVCVCFGVFVENKVIFCFPFLFFLSVKLFVYFAKYPDKY